MKRLLACSVLALAATVPMFVGTSGCTDDGTTDGGGVPLDGSTGTDGATTDAPASLLGFHPSNLESSPTLETTLAGSLGDVELSDCGPQVDASENGHMGCEGPGGAYRQIDGFGGTQKYAVFVAKNITVKSGFILSVGGDRPLILVALESIKVEGSIIVTEGFAGAYSKRPNDKDGAGAGAGLGSSNTTSGSGGGGGFCGKGGNGGAATATGGPAYGSPEIIPLQGGSTGGGLFSAEAGGAIQLVAGRDITIAAGSYIDVRGGGAVTGGGSGGAILLEAPTVKVLGTLAANGGGGGAPGGQGGIPGDRTSTPALGGVNAENINGGKGGAGTTVDGTNGVASALPGNGEGSASGGGGAGRIRINTRSGAAEISGLVTPALTTVCATQGTLH